MRVRAATSLQTAMTLAQLFTEREKWRRIRGYVTRLTYFNHKIGDK